MTNKKGNDSSQESDDSWNAAMSILHDIESPRIAVYSAIQYLEYELKKRGIRLSDNHFEYIYDYLDEMRLIVEEYAVISNPTWRLVISPSIISPHALLHSAIRHRKLDASRTRIIISGCERKVSLRLDERLFRLALRVLLSKPTAKFRPLQPSVVEVGCRSTQDKFLLQLHYNGGCVDENFRDYLFDLIKTEEKASTPIKGRLDRELEFIRQVIIAHGGNIQVTDNPHAIVVTIELPIFSSA
jgi:K+-sensing histidine kinase KdpD